MDGDDSEQNKKTEGKRKTFKLLQRCVVSVGDVLSPIWIRYRTIFSDIINRRHLESQFHYVFYIGAIFYFLYFIIQTHQ